jgi:hypothetical protein
MIKYYFTLVTIIYFVFISISVAASATVETENLIIRDVTEKLSPEELEKFAHKTDLTFAAVLKFWEADPRIQKLGKIIIEYNHPLPKANASLFFWKKEGGQRVRVVKVFGGDENPSQLAHKLTSALFPNPDKLIRNMMGEAAEKRFGNTLSFPMCGFDKDQWIMAIQKEGLYIPLTNIGSKHSDWGMDIVNDWPTVTDRVKQHISYLEAGSFGEFLIDTYGIDKMKHFYKLSLNEERPWQQIYGITLMQLETKWLGDIKLKTKAKEGEISRLASLLRSNPAQACFSAQNMAEKK